MVIMRSFKKSSVIFLLIHVLLLFNINDHSVYSASKKKEMEVHFINVGQGDSMLIQTPNNKNILIDAGRPEYGKQVVKYLKKYGVNKIDLMIATHPDIDHIGGLPYVMKAIKTDKIIDSGKLYTTKTYGRYINQIRKQNIPVTIAKENTKLKLDSKVQMTVLNTYAKGRNNNQSSIALKVTYEEIDFLLMSDIEQKQEKRLSKTYDIRAEIIKVAHHGSKTSSSLAFLQEVNPQVAILTYSKENDYGHPVNRVIENLNKINAHIYSTAAFGNVVIHTDGKNYFIIPEKNPASGITEKVG